MSYQTMDLNRTRKYLKQLKRGFKRTIMMMDPKFRNNKDPDKPALIFEDFKNLPTELRLQVWRFAAYQHKSITTLDLPHHDLTKIVQILPQDQSNYEYTVVPNRFQNALLRTSKESRCSMFKTTTGQESYIFMGSSTIPDQTTHKLIFSIKAGVIPFINHLKTCAASLSADALGGNVPGMFSNITTLAINDKNFYLRRLGATNYHVEFAKIADILSKFTSLTKLWIVQTKYHSNIDLGYKTKFDVGYNDEFAPMPCNDEYKLMRWVRTKAENLRGRPYDKEKWLKPKMGNKGHWPRPELLSQDD
ncbi:hypothetical protein VTL71DRAFT_1404 [Oculimacula yallundae]|uniref:2EXR domain-containing protein n=1 Tax=Oculimacula yallundae TaxID=86028 RepID=A0ABR4CAM5_9HELO